MAPSYLADAETLHPTADVGYVHVGVFGVLQHRRWLYCPHDAPRWAIEPSRWLLLERGMLFRGPPSVRSATSLTVSKLSQNIV